MSRIVTTNSRLRAGAYGGTSIVSQVFDTNAFSTSPTLASSSDAAPLLTSLPRWRRTRRPEILDTDVDNDDSSRVPLEQPCSSVALLDCSWTISHTWTTCMLMHHAAVADGAMSGLRSGETVGEVRQHSLSLVTKKAAGVSCAVKAD